MPYHATVRSERFAFADLRELFAKANEEKSGDHLAGIAAATERERVAAKLALAEVPLGEIMDNPVVDYAADDVTRLICDSLDRRAFQERLASLTVGELRERLLESDQTTLHDLSPIITPEVAAAAAKLMSNKDLILVASKIRNVS